VLLMQDAVRWREFKLALPYLLTFMQEYRPASSGFVFGQAWSLGYEEKFYLLWPLLIVLFFPFKRASAMIGLAIGAVWLLLPYGAHINYGSLFVGSLLAVVLAKSTALQLCQPLSQIPTLLAAMLVVGVYALFWFHPRFVILFSASIALLIGTLVLRTSGLRTVLEHPWIVLVGKRSYAMYLIHVLVIHAVERIATLLHACVWYTVIPFAYLLSFAGATVLFYMVERPCLAFGRNMSKEMRARSASGSRGAVPEMLSSLSATPIEHTVEPIEREEPGVPNAFAKDESEVSSQV
jgi:peptidoglycan/LPS O-acetylase OafA/YrhL